MLFIIGTNKKPLWCEHDSEMSWLSGNHLLDWQITMLSHNWTWTRHHWFCLCFHCPRPALETNTNVDVMLSALLWAWGAKRGLKKCRTNHICPKGYGKFQATGCKETVVRFRDALSTDGLLQFLCLFCEYLMYKCHLHNRYFIIVDRQPGFRVFYEESGTTSLGFIDDCPTSWSTVVPP